MVKFTLTRDIDSVTNGLIRATLVFKDQIPLKTLTAFLNKARELAEMYHRVVDKIPDHHKAQLMRILSKTEERTD